MREEGEGDMIGPRELLLITVEANNSPGGCGKLTSCATLISLSKILANQSGHPLDPWTTDLVFFSLGNILHQQWTKETGGRGVRTRDLVFFSLGNILHQKWTKETGGGV